MSDVDVALSKESNPIWYYIEIAGGIEGPFSKEDLKKDKRLSPDTYVWREGFKEWKKIRDIPELSDLFDEPAPPKKEEKPAPGLLNEELAWEHPPLPPPYLFWLYWMLVLLITFIYMFIYFSRK